MASGTRLRLTNTLRGLIFSDGLLNRKPEDFNIEGEGTDNLGYETAEKINAGQNEA